MKQLKRIIAALLSIVITISIMITGVTALEHDQNFDYIFEGSPGRDDGVDNSNLLVRVTKETVNGITVLYEGPLGGYDNGHWNNVAFTGSPSYAIYDWATNFVEVTRITPITMASMSTEQENVLDTSNEYSSINSIPDNVKFTKEQSTVNLPNTTIFDNTVNYECVQNAEELLVNTTEPRQEGETATSQSEPELLADFTFDETLFTTFNTITSPVMSNGANEPKFSYNNFIEENISDYSGELTLNFEDLILDGANGLDLRIGRTYQSVSAEMGHHSLIVTPTSTGRLKNSLIFDYSNYLLDRYNLGTGWSFNFPSVQIETEYIPIEVVNTYWYDEEKKLYYHSGNGDVYEVEFTPDTTDSNLKGYYNKDIQFNKNDTSYSNGQVSSYYSLTLADKTKQYFAEDGRLIGICDRFGNTIKFEHILSSTTNIVPNGNFICDGDAWSSSTGDDGSNDARHREKTNIGSNDNHVMYFSRNNSNGAYIISQPIQINPLKEYELGLRIRCKYGNCVDIEIIGYNIAYNDFYVETIKIEDYDKDTWIDFTQNFSMPSDIRYIQIKIKPERARDTYIDTVRLDEPKPLISKITDSVGRTVDFTYSGDPYAGDSNGSITLLVKSPDETQNRTLTYNKEVIGGSTTYLGHNDRRFLWYLSSSNTEDENGSPTLYQYNSGIFDEGVLQSFPKLYINYQSKVHSSTNSWTNKPILSEVTYKDRTKVYEYEQVRKHLGDDGYYDTLRVKNTYDKYMYAQENGEAEFKGKLIPISYSYEGTYNTNTFDNETGYPNFTFDDTTNLNEKWTVTKTGKTVDTVTFSNCAVKETTTASDDTLIKAEYTNHPEFKNSPTQIKTETTQNGENKETYEIYSYNDWGGIATQSREITSDILNNEELLSNYTSTYEYDPNYHYLTEKSYYHDIDKAQVSETFTYDTIGRITESKNAVGDIVQYFYEIDDKPYLLTKTVQDDPMGFQQVMGGSKETTYAFDEYGLYPITVSENFPDGVSQNQYTYDYITGDILTHTKPDNSVTEYTYYSDGKPDTVIYPPTFDENGEPFRIVNSYEYRNNICFTNYGEGNSVFSEETIDKHIIYIGNTPMQGRFGSEVNYYDSVGNLKANIVYDLSKQDSNGNYFPIITQYYHDNYDRLIKVIDSEGKITTCTYNNFDQTASITDPEGNVFTYSYDNIENAVSLMLTSSEGQKNLETKFYDLYGNVIKNRVYPDNTDHFIEENYEYDLNNNLTLYEDAEGNQTSYKYDALNRLIKTTSPNGETATATYSAFNKPSFEKRFDQDGAEKSSRVSYRNEKGDLTMQFSIFDKLLVETSTYISDAKGRTTTINEGENSKTVVYDELDNPLIQTSGNSQIHRRYHWYGEELSGSTDGSTAMTALGYDGIGNLSAKLQNNTHYMGYTYSPEGRVIQSEMPSERTESYAYTPNGNLATITSDGKIFDYDYYDTGLIKSISYPNGLKTEYIYDNIGRVTSMLTSVNNATITALSYIYDNNGNVLSVTQNGETTAYTYDSLNRLLSVTYADSSSVIYTYDALNNLTKETFSNGDIKDYVYNEKNQLATVKLNGEVTDSYTYNKTGAVTSHNDKVFSYNQWDTLSSFTDDNDTYTYKYDANGIRTQKNNKQYIVDIYNNVVAETDDAGIINAEILWGNNKPLARKVGSAWYYYIYNAHGDVIGLVNESGTVVNSYEYDPWGNILEEVETIDNPIKYAGEYFDDELGMYYLRARYYDPYTKRFTNYDIIEGDISNPLDMNRYVYCRNNPIKYVDPSGKFAIAATIASAPAWLPYAIAGATVVATGIISYFSPHSTNKSKVHWDKHTKKRPGTPGKAQKKPGWKDRSNKKKK